MIANTIPPELENNELFKRVQANKDEGNRAWLKRILKENNYKEKNGGLLLIGGNSVVDFRIRVAQSYLRYDLTPSHWSQVGILTGSSEQFYSVPLQWTGELSEMPHQNAIQKCRLANYDDPAHFPNIAFVQFTENPKDILKAAEQLKLQRSTIVDLVALVIKWLEHVLGVGKSANPLFDGAGLPSAVFAEIAFGSCGIELTPGLESAGSCPESIWQAAKWWKNYYEQSGEIETMFTPPIVPKGCFALRQPAAAIREKPFKPVKVKKSNKLPKDND